MDCNPQEERQQCRKLAYEPLSTDAVRLKLKVRHTCVCCDCHAIISCVKAWHAWIMSSLVLYCMAMTGVGPCKYGPSRASFNAGADEPASSPSRSSYSTFSRIFACEQGKTTKTPIKFFNDNAVVQVRH